MKFKRYGSINPNIKQEVNPKELIHLAVFKRLDFLLGFLEKQDENLAEEFIDKYQDQLKALLEQDPLSGPMPDYPYDLDQFPQLLDQLGLVNLSWLFFLSLLEITPERVKKDTAIEVPDRNGLRASLVPRYYHALVLSNMLGKEKATEILKAYIDEFLISLSSGANKFDDLESQWNSYIENASEGGNNGWLNTASDIEDGKYVWRNDNCKWIDALDDLEDKDLVYLACCYGDFQNAKLRNKNFVMTREVTIAEGAPYCDKVFHDKRISNLEHPNKEFWESIDSQIEE